MKQIKINFNAAGAFPDTAYEAKKTVGQIFGASCSLLRSNDKVNIEITAQEGLHFELPKAMLITYSGKSALAQTQIDTMMDANLALIANKFKIEDRTQNGPSLELTVIG